MSKDKKNYDEESFNEEVKQDLDQQETQDNSANNTEVEETVPSELEKLKEELAKQEDKYVRLFAEFDNYKRRTSRERVEMFKTAGQEVMTSILPVLDDLDRALTELKKSSDKNLIEGIELINNKLNETLRKQGLEEMTVKVGDKFDSDLHEAVTQIPAPKKKMIGKIIDVIPKGYVLGDRIIRYPKVVTGA